MEPLERYVGIASVRRALRRIVICTPAPHGATAFRFAQCPCGGSIENQNSAVLGSVGSIVPSDALHYGSLKPANAMFHLRFVASRVSEHQTLDGGFMLIIFRQGRNIYAQFFRSLADSDVTQSSAQMSYDLDTGLRGQERHVFGNVPFAETVKNLPAGSIDSPHPFQVSAHMPIQNEIGESRLQQQRCELTGRAERVRYPTAKRGRQDHESKTECREKQLGECADINDATGAIHGLDRR